MSDQTNMNNNLRKEPNRKEPRQISFRVSESEYEKLKQSADILSMSVPNFVKKKAHGARVIAPKIDGKTAQTIVRNLSGIANNINQIAKYFHTHKGENTNFEGMEKEIRHLKSELNEIWQQLS